MPKYLLLHYGYVQPTSELMKAWGAWSDSIAEQQVEQGGFAAGVEVSARRNPSISSIRVYELR